MGACVGQGRSQLRRKPTQNEQKNRHAGGEMFDNQEMVQNEDDLINPQHSVSQIVKKPNKVKTKSSPKTATLPTERKSGNNKRTSILQEFKLKSEIIQEEQYGQFSKVLTSLSHMQMDYLISKNKAGPISVPHIQYAEQLRQLGS